MHFKLKLLLLISTVLIFSGCVPVIVGTGMVAGGYTAARDKKIGDTLNDSKIDIEIKKKLYAVNPKLYSEVSVVTDRGCVLLTGIVSDPDWISTAERQAWSVEGVMEVNNNIMSGDPSNSQMLKDDYITTACKSALLCKSNVRSVNYKIKTFDSVVYVLGIARSEEELETALAALQKVKGVKKVVSYVNVLEISNDKH